MESAILIYIISIASKLSIVFGVLAILSFCVLCTCLFYNFYLKDEEMKIHNKKILRNFLVIFSLSGFLFIVLPNERQINLMAKLYYEIKLENIKKTLKEQEDKEKIEKDFNQTRKAEQNETK